MRKNTPERQRELDEKAELERLLGEESIEVENLVKQAKDILPGRAANFMDYGVVKTETDSRADDIVNSVAYFYLPEDSIEGEAYIRQKSMVDKITVSNLLFQMKTAEYAIIRLLEEMDNGSVHARTFEVLASLQKSKMEIVKHLASFMTIMEENYKKIKEDYRVKVNEAPLLVGSGEITIHGGSDDKFTMRGTRGLLETLREAVPETRAVGELKKEETEDGEE